MHVLHVHHAPPSRKAHPPRTRSGSRCHCITRTPPRSCTQLMCTAHNESHLRWPSVAPADRKHHRACAARSRCSTIAPSTWLLCHDWLKLAGQMRQGLIHGRIDVAQGQVHAVCRRLVPGYRRRDGVQVVRCWIVLPSRRGELTQRSNTSDHHLRCPTQKRSPHHDHAETIVRPFCAVSGGTTAV